MAVVVIGGLITSTLLSLLVIPVSTAWWTTAYRQPANNLASGNRATRSEAGRRFHAPSCSAPTRPILDLRQHQLPLAAAQPGLPFLGAAHQDGGDNSGINDGAAALPIGSAAVGERPGVKPLARIMGVSPAYAIPKALARAGLTVADDVIEINEARPQVLGRLKLLGLAEDDPRINPNGGAIAIGPSAPPAPAGADRRKGTGKARRPLRRGEPVHWRPGKASP
jgi:hypothetical protein